MLEIFKSSKFFFYQKLRYQVCRSERNLKKEKIVEVGNKHIRMYYQNWVFYWF